MREEASELLTIFALALFGAGWDLWTHPIAHPGAGGQSTTKWWRGRIMHLYRLARPCAECGAEMRIDVSKAALDGTAKNAGLHLKRCATCRARAKALGTTSRPQTEDKHAFSVPVEPAMADTIIATMKEELTGLYAQNKELRERLSKYEAPRMPWEG